MYQFEAILKIISAIWFSVEGFLFKITEIIAYVNGT